MNKRYTAIIIFVIFAILLSAVFVTADSSDRKVVMVVIPGVSLQDLLSPDLPNIRKLIDESATGLMNSRTAGRPDGEEDRKIDPKYTPESGYLTLGAVYYHRAESISCFL